MFIFLPLNHAHKFHDLTDNSQTGMTISTRSQRNIYSFINSAIWTLHCVPNTKRPVQRWWQQIHCGWKDRETNPAKQWWQPVKMRSLPMKTDCFWRKNENEPCDPLWWRRETWRSSRHHHFAEPEQQTKTQGRQRHQKRLACVLPPPGRPRARNIPEDLYLFAGRNFLEENPSLIRVIRPFHDCNLLFYVIFKDRLEQNSWCSNTTASSGGGEWVYSVCEISLPCEDLRNLPHRKTWCRTVRLECSCVHPQSSPAKDKQPSYMCRAQHEQVGWPKVDWKRKDHLVLVVAFCLPCRWHCFASEFSVKVQILHKENPNQFSSNVFFHWMKIAWHNQDIHGLLLTFSPFLQERVNSITITVSYDMCASVLV